MAETRVTLDEIACARSGDKGASANVGVVARCPEAYEVLRRGLTASRVAEYFTGLQPRRVVRYELANLQSLNFVLDGALGEGGSRSLRIDAQGKVLGQALLLLPIDVPDEVLARCRALREREGHD